MNCPILHAMATGALFLMLVGTASAEPTFESRKKCYTCHKSQGESWNNTLHRKAGETFEKS